jgi:lycopene cyclase CruA
MSGLKNSGTELSVPDLSEFRKRYPLTVASFGSLADREKQLARIWRMDQRWRQLVEEGQPAPEEVLVKGAPPASLSVEAEFEIIYAGGALGLLHAAVMAHRYKRRVMVFDPEGVGRADRDWNISDEELSELERAGLFSREELDALVLNRCRSGFVKFHDAASRVKTPPLWMSGVCDVALDAKKLLDQAARKLKAGESESVLMEGLRFVRCYVQPDRVLVLTEERATKRLRLFAARLFIDAMGTDSTVARQLQEGRSLTHVRPTVGTVARGFVRGRAADQVDFRVGEILVSREDAHDHRQLIWEGFAGNPARDEYTTYLFFYDALDSPADKSLLALFERYFEKLPAYKRTGAQWRVLRPVFGYAPSSQHQGRLGRRRVAEDRVMLIGDAAGFSSPLAGSGLGPHLRHLKRLTHLVDLGLEADLLDQSALAEISAAETGVAHLASLAEFLRPTPKSEAPAVNETLNAVMGALHSLDERVRRELFQNRMTLMALKNLLSRTVRLYPRIIHRVREHLGARGTLWWLVNIAEAGFSERREARRLPLESGAAEDEEPAQTFARYLHHYQRGDGAPDCD